MLNYFTYWTIANQKNGKFIVDGIAYVKVTYPELEKIFCHWGVCTIKRAIYSLQSSGYIEIHHFGSGIDKTNWYRATDKAVELLHMDSVLNESTSYQSDTSIVSNRHHPSYQSDTSIVSNRHHPSYQSDTSIVSKTQNLQYTKEREKRKSKRKTTARAKLAPPFENPSPKLLEAWEGFVEHRKAIRAPLTPRAVTLTANELERLAPGNDDKKAAILDQSVERGWRGVFPLKDNTNQRQGGNVHREQTVEEMYAEAQEILKNGGGII